MKSFFALALLGAIAFADEAADKVTDADAKASAQSGHAHGDTIEIVTGKSLENGTAMPDTALTTGGVSRGSLKTWTGWHRTTGTDGQLYFDFVFKVEPTADYVATSVLDIGFAADMHKDKVDYTRWTRTVSGSNTLISYGHSIIDRSVYDILATPLSSTETSAITSSTWRYLIASTGDIQAFGSQTTDDNFWDVDVEKSVGNASDASKTIFLSRKSTGVEEIKLGGASYVQISFTDTGGNVSKGQYMRWAEEEHDDGAASLATFGALAAAAIVALF